MIKSADDDVEQKTKKHVVGLHNNELFLQSTKNEIKNAKYFSKIHMKHVF